MRLTGEDVFVLVLSAAHGMQHFFGRIFPPLIPLLATDLSMPLWKLGMAVTVWSVSVGLGQAPLGQLSDRYDRRFLLPTGLAVVGLGYLIVAGSTMIGGALPTITALGVELTGSFQVLLAGMIIAGLGKSATHPTGYPLLSANVAEERKGRALGRWGSAAKIGDAASPAFVAVGILFLSWQAVFLAVSGIAFLFATGLFVYMSRSQLATLPAGRSTAPDKEAGTGDDAQYRRTALLLLTAMVASAFALRGIGTYLPTFITEVYAFTFQLGGITFRPESVASIYFSILLLSGAVGALFVGRVTDRYDPRLIVIGLLAAGTGTLALLAFLPLGPLSLLIITIFVGVTLFATGPARDAILSAVTPPEREGRVFGNFWTAFLLLTGAYPVIIGYISDTAGIQQSFALLGIGTLVAIIPMLVLQRTDVVSLRR